MSNFDIISQIENATAALQKASAVLFEAEEYFEKSYQPGSYEAHWLVANTEHILLLLYIIGDLLSEARPQLDEASTALIKNKPKE